MSWNGVFLSGTVYELCLTLGSFAPCCSLAAAKPARPRRSNAPAPAAPRARNSRRRRYADSGVISDDGDSTKRSRGMMDSVVSAAGSLHGSCSRGTPFGGRRWLRRRFADDGRYRSGRLRFLRPRLGLRGAALVPLVPALARLALLIGRKLGAVQIADEAHTRTARAERCGQLSTRHVISRGRLWRGCLGGRRTIRCAGTRVGSFPSAARRRLRSRMAFCSDTESLSAWSRQNHRLRGPAPGLPHPGTGQSRPDLRPSTLSFPAEMRATTARTSRSTTSVRVRLRSMMNRSTSARTGSFVFWAIANVAVSKPRPLGRLGRLDYGIRPRMIPVFSSLTRRRAECERNRQAVSARTGP